MRERLTFQIGGHLSGLAAVILITVVFQHEFPLAKTTTIVLTYLLAVLIASTVWGLGVSVVMSVLAALCVDYYFLPPVGTFNITDTQDWVALFFISHHSGDRERSIRSRAAPGAGSQTAAQ